MRKSTRPTPAERAHAVLLRHDDVLDVGFDEVAALPREATKATGDLKKCGQSAKLGLIEFVDSPSAASRGCRARVFGPSSGTA